MNDEKEYILLFNPDPQGEYKAIPYGLLYLERAVRQLNIEVLIIDAQIENNFYETLADLKGKVLLCGISAILGNQVKGGLAFGQWAHEQLGAAVVWGGWFASWKPEILFQNQYVDYVIVGQGEVPFRELVSVLIKGIPDNGEGLETVPNLLFRTSGSIRRSKTIAPYAVSNFPPIDLQKIKVPAYGTLGNSIHFIASQGCPCDCSFCFLSAYWKTYWEAGNINDVISGIEYIRKAYPEIRHISFDDSNLFADREFTMTLAKYFREKHPSLRWCGTTNISGLLEKYSDDDLLMLQRSGCETIYAGAESGDAETLKYLNKRLDDQQTLVFVRRLKQAGIKVSLSFMSLYPGNTNHELKKTMRLISRVKLLDPTIKYTINLYYPSRKNKFYFLAKEQGMRPPESIEDYLSFFAGTHRLPWHTDYQYRMLAYYSLVYFRFIDLGYHRHGATKKHWLLKACNLTAFPLVWLRFKTGLFGFNLDAKIYLWLLKGEISDEFKNAETNFMTRRYKIH